MTNGTFRRVWRDFEAWRSAMRDDTCPDCLRLLLQGRIDYLAKPDPTHWKSGDVRELLLELAVTRMTDLCDLVGHGVDSLRSYLRFLDQTGWLHPGSATMKVLHRELDRAAAAYPQAMADTSRWRLAKRLYTAMRAAGVDLGADDAIHTWVEAFNQRPPADRREVLGELLDGQPELGRARLVAHHGLVAALAPGAPVPPQLQRDPPDDEPAGAYPPVVLADDQELATAARASSLLRRVVTLARWVGVGRPVSRHGELIPPDARALVDALGLSEGLAEAPGGWKVTSMRDVPPLTKRSTSLWRPSWSPCGAAASYLAPGSATATASTGPATTRWRWACGRSCSTSPPGRRPHHQPTRSHPASRSATGPAA
jgi:hypothetical protein